MLYIHGSEVWVESHETSLEVLPKTAQVLPFHFHFVGKVRDIWENLNDVGSFGALACSLLGPVLLEWRSEARVDRRSDTKVR